MLPRVQLLARSRLKRFEKIRQGRGTKAVFVKVAACSLIESILSNPGDQLLQYGGSLSVGYPVKIGLSCGDVGDVSGNGVRRWHLILRVCPDLAIHSKVGPLPRVLRRRRDRAGALVFGEGFLEPQVVPPRGGRQVTEPHVAHFVQGRVRASLPLGERRGGTGDVALVEGDTPGVFHRTQVVFGNVDLVVGTPREGHAITLMEKIEARTRHFKNVVGVEVAGQRAAACQAQGQFNMSTVAGATTPGAPVDDGPRTRDERSDVAGQRRCRGKVVTCSAGTGLLACHLNTIGENHPRTRGDDVERPGGLHVGLVDARPRPMCVVRLKLCVEVDLCVFRVSVAVEALAAARVVRQCTHLESDGFPHR